MLEVAIALQLVAGDCAEAGIVAVLLLSNAALGFFQEGQAQATLDALKVPLGPAGRRPARRNLDVSFLY